MPNTIIAGSLVAYQLDITDPPSLSSVVFEPRVEGIEHSSLELKIFRNNSIQNWVFEDGYSVPSSSISSGKVYFNEIPGLPGFYSVRTLLNSPGIWRIILKHSGVEYIREFDVLPNTSLSTPAGISVSFS